MTIALALLAATSARAATVEASSTTLLNVAQQTRGGANPLDPELVTVAPAFEILTLSAHGLTAPRVEDVRIVLQTWGAWDIGDRRWDSGVGGKLTGDVVTGYLQGRLARMLTLRVGRAQVMTGVSRMIQLDGAQAILAAPFGLTLSGYAGSPVAQRFASRSGLRSWNPVGGDLAYGGRAAYSLALPGAPGRGLDVGVSANVVEDGSHSVREEVGVDLRVEPVAAVLVTGLGAMNLEEERLSEAGVRVGWSPMRKLHLDVDWRYVAPDLLLARNSILSVFSTANRNEFGAGATYDLFRSVAVGASYHLQLEPGEKEEDSRYLGHEAEANVEWERGHTLAGAELSYLDTLENGYVAARVFGRQELGRLFATVDLMGHRFREEVNRERLALTGTLSAGVDLAKGFGAVVSGRAGMTPFFEQTYEVMAKLVYNQTYRVREVR
jgi:hypothetical protein